MRTILVPLIALLGGAGVTPETTASQRLDALRSSQQHELHGALDNAIHVLAPHAKGDDPLATALRFHHARLRLQRGDELSPPEKLLLTPSDRLTVRWGVSRQQEADALLSLAAAEPHAVAKKRLRDRAAVEYPRWVPAPDDLDREARHARARNLIRDMDYDAALVALDELAAEAEPAERRALQREVGRLIGDKMRANYERVAQIFSELSESEEATPDDMLYLAYANGKLDDRLAADTYRRFIQRYPKHPECPKANFLIAWTQFHLEQLPTAVTAFDDFLASYPDSGYRFATRWYRGLAHFRLKQYELAAADFDYTARHTSERDRGRYWLARTWLERNEPQRASPLLASIAKRSPFSYYGMMARALLAPEARAPLFDEVTRPPRRAMTEHHAQRAMQDLPKRAAMWIAEAFAAQRAGEPTLAAALLRHAEKHELRAAKFAALKLWLQPQLGAVHQHIRSKRARRCRRALGNDPSQPRVRDCWRALYPTPYAEQIDRVRGELPPTLFWAVMRQESFFMPQARSHADALGLMQVIPQVGSPAAEALGATFAPYEMYTPTTNLRYFAHAARSRFERFGGHLPLVLMSYNATPAKAANWLNENHDMPFDLFVEEIPWSETRNYVKHIASHLARYRTLEGADGDLLSRSGLPHPTAIVGDVFGDVLTADSPG